MGEAADIYTSLRAKWADLGEEIQELREFLGVDACPVCKHVVPPGKRHRRRYGNQLFACVVVDDPAEQTGAPT